MGVENTGTLDSRGRGRHWVLARTGRGQGQLVKPRAQWGQSITGSKSNMVGPTRFIYKIGQRDGHTAVLAIQGT
jgi:hypothetical protein